MPRAKPAMIAAGPTAKPSRTPARPKNFPKDRSTITVSVPPSAGIMLPPARASTKASSTISQPPAFAAVPAQRQQIGHGYQPPIGVCRIGEQDRTAPGSLIHQRAERDGHTIGKGHAMRTVPRRNTAERAGQSKVPQAVQAEFGAGQGQHVWTIGAEMRGGHRLERMQRSVIGQALPIEGEAGDTGPRFGVDPRRKIDPWSGCQRECLLRAGQSSTVYRPVTQSWAFAFVDLAMPFASPARH